MLKYHLAENGWTVILEDFDFKTATQEDADKVAELLSSNICVVANNRSKIAELTPEDEVKFCSMIGSVYAYDQDTAFGRAVSLGKDESAAKIQRVTASLNDEGHPGLFGQDDELDWHSNKPWDKDRKSFIWLKSHASAKGSRTSITNTILAYEDLKKEDPEFVAELERRQYRVVTGWRKGRETGGHTVYYDYWKQYGEMEDVLVSEGTALPLIMTNEGGHRGFFLPYLQSHTFFGYTEEHSRPIMERIWNYCLQDKYVYHHDWEDDNEIMLMEQWLSVHKRWAYNHNPNRILHRIELNFDNTTWFKDRKQNFRKMIYDTVKQNLREIKQRQTA